MAVVIVRVKAADVAADQDHRATSEWSGRSPQDGREQIGADDEKDLRNGFRCDAPSQISSSP